MITRLTCPKCKFDKNIEYKTVPHPKLQNYWWFLSNCHKCNNVFTTCLSLEEDGKTIRHIHWTASGQYFPPVTPQHVGKALNQ